jgi:hypothetical protein
MTFQFGRSVIAEFADVKIEGTEGLRVTFSVERDKLPWPNNAELAVYNLNPVTRSMLTSAGKVTARIQAGYKGEINQLFFGVLDIVEHIKEGPTWVTRMSCSDAGEKCKQARLSTTFKKGATRSEVIRALLNSLGLGEGNLSSFATKAEIMRKLPFASTLHGNASEELAYFLRASGLEFSIQDQKIQFLEIGKGAPNLKSPLISPTSGLIGSPRLVREKATDLTRKSKKPVNPVPFLSGADEIDMITTVEGECLLNAGLVPGVTFRLESETVNGDFLACATRTTGDTHGPDWTTRFKGMPLAA